MSEGYIIGGGGTTGATLTVTGVAGDTVTITKDSKTYTRTFNSDGVAVFKGLATGTWTVTMTNGTQTATMTVVVTADYETSISYFTATINVTYPAGSTCTATDGTTTLTAPDTSGAWTCVVPNAGTWTITATNGDKTKSQSVSITTKGQTASVGLSYELYLFNYNPCTNITGSWKNKMDISSDTVTATTNSNGSVTLDTTGAGGRTYKFIPKSFVPGTLANYKKCCGQFSGIYNPGHSWGGCSFDIYNGNTSYHFSVSDPNSPIASKGVAADGTFEIDISNISSGFPTVCVTGRKLTVNRIWLA